jgi:hypothetical protein
MRRAVRCAEKVITSAARVPLAPSWPTSTLTTRWYLVHAQALVCHASSASAHNLTCLRRNALAITLTDENAMAAAAMIGDNRMPRKG